MKRSFLLIGLMFLSLSISAIAVKGQVVIGPQINVTIVRYDPYPAQPGGYVNLWINVENQGGLDAPDVTVELLPAYPFSLDPGVSATNNVGKISASDSAMFQYKVRVDGNAVTGINGLKYRYQSNNDNTWAEGTLDIYILGKSKIDVSDVSTTVLEPGKTTPVVFTLNNAGSSTIRDLVFSWNQPSGLILPVGSDNKVYVDSIAAGEKDKMTFMLTTNPGTTPGVYPVDLAISYSDGNATSTANSEIGFIIGGTTDFDVSAQGSSGQVSLSIANIGANNAKSVTVEIPDQAGFSATGGSSSILGNLNSGDYTTASFQLTSRISRNATAGGFGQTAGNQSLLVRITYTDTTGQRQSADKEVPIPPGTFSSSSSTGTGSSGFSGRNQSNGNSLIYIIIGVAGIAAIVGFFLYRKRKKKK